MTPLEADIFAYGEILENPRHHFAGRTYPVEVRYQPRDADGQALDAAGAVRRAIGDLLREGPGDILVFSSGEAEINDICESIRKHERDLEVLPLYARLSTAEQQRVFSPAKQRRVVVATNVAETSLTVPGIRYVIDLGDARISRFSQRTKVQRLPIEPISQASANQRSGRCGRLGPGIAIRLYDEEDFDNRPEFTEPEIQRTSLASVILQLARMRFGDISVFAFLEPPDVRLVKDGIRLLQELGALDQRRSLTQLGQRLARIALDQTYGIPAVSRGPAVQNVQINGAGIIVTFDHVAGGLETRAVDSQPDAEEAVPVSISADELGGFALCGSDQVFYWAIEAEIIRSNQVRIANVVDVPNPVSIRYAWVKYPRCNLYNSEGLPAEPFRTDNYEFGASSGAEASPINRYLSWAVRHHLSEGALGNDDGDALGVQSVKQVRP